MLGAECLNKELTSFTVSLTSKVTQIAVSISCKRSVDCISLYLLDNLRQHRQVQQNFNPSNFASRCQLCSTSNLHLTWRRSKCRFPSRRSACYHQAINSRYPVDFVRAKPVSAILSQQHLHNKPCRVWARLSYVFLLLWLSQADYPNLCPKAVRNEIP